MAKIEKNTKCTEEFCYILGRPDPRRSRPPAAAAQRLDGGCGYAEARRRGYARKRCQATTGLCSSSTAATITEELHRASELLHIFLVLHLVVEE